MKFALVIDGIVDAISLEDQEQPWMLVPDDVFAGFTSDGKGGWVNPNPPPVLTEVAKWRTSARLDRGPFCRALRDAGILSAEEAITAAKGEWPASFAAGLQSLPVDPVDAQIDWAAASQVGRTNPLFMALLNYYADTNELSSNEAEALGDSIFGWVEPA